MNYLIIILITFISGVVGTGLGGVVGAVMKRDSNKIVSLLLSFAAGIMLAVVCFDLMSEPLHMMEEGRQKIEGTNYLKIDLDSYDGEEPYIFISYSHADTEKVYKILKIIDKEKYRFR